MSAPAAAGAAKGRGGPGGATTDEEPVVFVIDDDAMVRDSLADLLHSVRLETFLFDSARAFLESVRPDRAACILLDIRLPEISGLEFQRMLQNSDIPVPVIFISGHADIPMTVRAMKAGAVEVLTKPINEQNLLDAVNVAIDRDRARRRQSAVQARILQRFQALTAREKEILPLVISGRASKQIAYELSLSEMTVKVHRSQIMRKMQAKSVIELVRMADQLVPGVSGAELPKG